MKIIEILAEDCRPFKFDKKCDKKANDCERVLSQFISEFSDDSVFPFSPKSRRKNSCEEEEPFAVYDYKKGNWVARRWVGWSKIISGNTDYLIKVDPRFINLVLVKMIEEIFSIKILKTYTNEELIKKDLSSILQKLIPYIWTNKLGMANKYGVPRHSVINYHKGAKIKGRLDVRKSIVPFFRQNELVSIWREKEVNEPIAQILVQTKKELEKKSHKNFYTTNDNAYNAILNFESAGFHSRRITEFEYQKIQYRSIYQSFKDVVDFSWHILMHKNFNQDSDSEKKGFGLFVDMAEIWELYLLSLFKKNFPDWKIESPENIIYKGKSYEKKTIPDIVLTKGNTVAVFDAKWKKMEYDYNDFDRTDFFQIHAYISYYNSNPGKVVLAGGLLYPLSDIYRDEVSNTLFGIDNGQTKFIIDGIDLSKMKSKESNSDSTIYCVEESEKSFKESEKSFISRMKKVLEVQ